MRNHFYIGLDLGQRQDFTALAVVETIQDARIGYDWVRHLRTAQSEEVSYRLRALERLRLGTSYMRVIARVRDLVRHPDMAGRCSLIADATGVGAPVVEILRAADIGCDITPVIITGGDRETRHGIVRKTPKRDLIMNLHVMLEHRRLRIAPGLFGLGAFAEELTNFQRKRTAAGNLQYGAFEHGAHDDLTLAVALACWAAHRPVAGERSERLCY